MYHERYGFKSGVSNSIKKDLDDVVLHAFQYNPDPKRWLDIASNDGTLLSFVPVDVYRVGVDPVKFLCEEAQQHANAIINDYFTFYTIDANRILHEKFDVVTSISCFYDMPNPNQFVSDVRTVLADKGIWIIQQNYLLTTMELSAVDNFCHEHIEYYTLMALENLLASHGLEVNEVSLSSVNGGSIRTVVSRRGTYPIDDSVAEQRKKEKLAGLENLESYKDFASKIGTQLDQLHRLVKGAHDEGKTVAILAASTRGSTIWQSADIDASLVEYAVERNEAKVGANFTPIGIPIISEEEFRERRPDYAIIGPWFFADEIIEREQEYLKSGGKLIKPLPKVEVIEWQS
jgi:NDP-4-keto-2,6-dideoxyhexose 3-C-methyltransferase